MRAIHGIHRERSSGGLGGLARTLTSLSSAGNLRRDELLALRHAKRSEDEKAQHVAQHQTEPPAFADFVGLQARRHSEQRRWSVDRVSRRRRQREFGATQRRVIVAQMKLVTTLDPEKSASTERNRDNRFFQWPKAGYHCTIFGSRDVKLKNAGSPGLKVTRARKPLLRQRSTRVRKFYNAGRFDLGHVDR